MPQVTSVKDVDVAGKRVLVRADINVPLLDGKVVDDTRIRVIIPTLTLLHERGAKQIIILAHLGRPGGVVVDGLRMAPVAARLRELTPVPFEIQENLRFDPREEANDAGFAKELAALGDIYVNEAFADSHRAHSSIIALPTLLPSYAGLRLLEEIDHLTHAHTPPQGSLAIVGGAKFETKLPLIQKLLEHYHEILLGGALGNDLIKARGMPFGASTISTDAIPVVVATNEALVAPTDAVLSAGAGVERDATIADIRAGERIVDIGPHTREVWSKKVVAAPFVLWNGPLGVGEEGFSVGTDTVGQALAQSGVHAVVGGGETIAAIKKFNFDPAKVFFSTGGGAMLEFLVQGTLPGIEALKRDKVDMHVGDVSPHN